MVFLTQVDNGEIDIDKGLFLSFEMSKRLAKEINAGSLSLSSRLFPVHLPWEGLLKNDFGENNNLKIKEEDWIDKNLPYIYEGQDLNLKKMVVFPMHGLGDQLYLAAALRNVAKKYPSLEVLIVKPSMISSEQWYDYIYFDDFFSITGPVVTIEEMKTYDYYVAAEHFAYKDEYEGMYPPEFYLRYLFFNEENTVDSLKPEISSKRLSNTNNKNNIDVIIDQKRNYEGGIVFINTITTGRVRDIPDDAVLNFIEQIKNDFFIIVSAYKNKLLEDKIEKLKLPNIVTANNYISSIDDLIYILSKVDYIITSDSGITHLAETLKVPCGSVFNVVTPLERTKPYNFSEQMMVEFEMQGVCETPCYIHALDDSEECPGMKATNKNEPVPQKYAPCMENFTGEHLLMLLNSLVSKFPKKKTGSETTEFDEIIKNNVFRKDVFDAIPEKTSKILDFGCNQGELLLRLKRDKNCSELYGIEINDTSKAIFDKYLDGNWIINLGDEDVELEEKYLKYFSYIIMHDVVEHLYDPWYVVAKLRKYLAKDGQLIVVVPNLQYWGIIDQIINGKFPYGAGGLMNEDHIRWFTCNSIVELAIMAGYKIDYLLPIFPPGTDLSGYNDSSEKKVLQFPPVENENSDQAGIQISFSDDLKKNYYLFLANKILLVFNNSDKPIELKKLMIGDLQKRKEAVNIDFKCSLG